MRALAFIAALAATPAAAAPEGYFDLVPGVTLETGDTWTDGDQRYRLWGIQSCLRGTTYTDNSGATRDCGEASLAVLSAYIADTAPICAPVARSSSLTYVMCYATVGNERLDLGTLLVTSGYAFAALNPSGLPYHPAYSVMEIEARDQRAGLWQFDDVQHPSILLSRNAQHQTESEARQ
jgi:endonuclease YncB( thermonuclease family)